MRKTLLTLSFVLLAATPLTATDYGDIPVKGVERTIGDGEGAEDTVGSVTVDYDYVSGGRHDSRFYNGRNGGTGNVGTATLNGGYCYFSNGYDGGTGNVGTATLNSGTFYNGHYYGTGIVGTATVNDHGTFYNGHSGGTGTVGTATLFATAPNSCTFYNGYYGGGTGTVSNATVNGYFYNGYYGGTGNVGTATVNTYGSFFNGYYGGTGNVGTATVNTYGWFFNGYDGGTGNVETAIVNDGYFRNGYYGGGTGNVSNATVNKGYFFNGYDGGTGKVDTATLNSGTFYNGCYGTGNVETATVYSGTFRNGDGGIGKVDTATLNGGSFYNGYYRNGNGNVDHLIYNDGTYQANLYGGTSSIGTLTLGKKVSESQGAEFMKSAPQKLTFGQDYGVINITGTADAANNLAFTNDIYVTAPTVDLTGTKIDVSVAALLTGNASSDPLQFLFDTYFATDGFSLASLFNDQSIITGGNAIEDLWFSWGTDADESVYLIAGGVVNLAAGFSWTNETRTAIAWTLPEMETSGSAATPEPATLALFGLGIAGLAAMRKRQRK